MKSSELKIGDYVRIFAVPGVGILNYTIFPETIEAYEKIIARKRPVRISEIDEDGTPWYHFRLKALDGKWEYHYMSIAEDDTNWKLVKCKT